MKGTIINNEGLFDIWCKMVASDIMDINFVSTEEVQSVLKSSILLGVDKFLDCLSDRLEYEYNVASKKTTMMYELYGKESTEFNEALFKSKKAKSRIKQIRQERHLQNGHKRSDYKHKIKLMQQGFDRLKEMIIEHNQDIILEKFLLERRNKT